MAMPDPFLQIQWAIEVGLARGSQAKQAAGKGARRFRGPGGGYNGQARSGRGC